MQQRQLDVVVEGGELVPGVAVSTDLADAQHVRPVQLDIAVIESLRLLQKVYRVSEQDFRNRIDRFDAVLDLKSYLHTPARKLSLGRRMRSELAAALIHNPRVFFLDERTIGLDVAVKARIREFLHEVNRGFGTTILLTTHDLDDIEALSQRVVVIDKDQKIYDGSLHGRSTA